MALAEVHWFSKVLGKQVGMNVILPEQGRPPFRTMYLLHGLSDDYTIWLRRSRIEWHVRELPLMVVMPDGYRGFYTDNAQGPAYAKYMAEELTAFVERTFPAKRTRGGRCISGLSMGGYGALRLALGYPEVFASAHSHSGALLHGGKAYSRAKSAEFHRVFGSRPEGTEHDLLHLARQAKQRKSLPRLRIDCGREDFLIDDNRQFHRELEQMKLPHKYEEFAGGHDWDYWEQHIRTAVMFHMTGSA
jgi:putative tributyrin esterase